MAKDTRMARITRGLIDNIGKPLKWRQCATDVLINHENDRRFNRWLMGGLYGMNIAIISLLIKLIFFPG